MKTRLTVKVRAGAKSTRFAGRVGDAWKLLVATPPVDGRANRAIARHLAEVTGLAPSNIRIVSGFTAPMKILELEGIDAEHLHRAILESHEPRLDTGSAAPREA